MKPNNAFVHRLCAALSILALASCGGGGGGGDSSGGDRYSISLSPASITFNGAQFTDIPAQTLTATFNGDGVVVGTRPGEVLPPWLTIVNTASGGGRADFSIDVNTGDLAPGNHSFTLRFATGKADGTAGVIQDLPVTLNLREGFSVTPTMTTFTGVEGSNVFSPAGGRTIQITGESVAWSIDSPPSWLQFSPASGSTRGSVIVTPRLDGLAAGHYQAQVRFNDSVSGSHTFAVFSLDVSAPQLTISDTQFDVTIDDQTPESATHRSFQISDTGLGQNAGAAVSWTVTSNSPLLKASPASGTTAGAPTTVMVDLDRNQLNALRSGTHTPTLTVNYPNNNSAYIHLNLTVRLPRAGSANPYLLTAGSPTVTTITGEDFVASDIGLLRLNGQSLSAFGASASLVNDREIQLTLPALTADNYELGFQNTLGLWRSAATIKVFNSLPGPGVGELVTSGNRVKLLFDRARNRAYGIDTLDWEIERYEWNGAQWASLSSVPLTMLTDAALMRDGNRLVATAAGGLWMVDLDSDVATLEPGTTHLDCINGHPRDVAVTAAGTVFASNSNFICDQRPYSIGGYSHVQELDLLSGYMDNPEPSILSETPFFDWNFTSASVEESGDGRTLVVGSTSTSGGRYGVFDLQTRSLVDSGDYDRFGVYYYARLDSDSTGNKILINNTYVRDRSGTTLGLLPANSAACLSSDGTRVYVFVRDSGGTGNVKVIDVSTGVGAANTFPQIGADIPVASNLGTPDSSLDYGNVTSFGIALSADEHLVLVAGSTRVVAVAIP